MILILGGTTEASALAGLLAARPGWRVLLSLAGRTGSPLPQPVPVRVGGFGGGPGLAAFLKNAGIDTVVDATHPFATGISQNAIAACRQAGVPLLLVCRPAWRPGPEDRWTEVPDAVQAALALGGERRTVFLTVGRLELPAFLAAPQHRYVVRTIDPPDRLPPDAELILARGPFAEADEHRLMQSGGIEVLVAKNAGGAATAGKLAAARMLGLPVVLIRRPAGPKLARDQPMVETPAAALAWLIERHAGAQPRGV